MTHPSESYVGEWQRAADLSRHAGPQGIRRLRVEAWEQFLSLGFPSTRDEDWRFTSVAPIADGDFALALPSPAVQTESAVAPFRLPLTLAAELVFVDGRYAPALSRRGTLPHGARVESLAASLATDGYGLAPYLGHVAPFQRQPFVALNTAFLGEGACIRLPAGAILAAPIHVLFVSTGAQRGRSIMTHPRVLVVLDGNSQASLVETHAGPAGARYLTNAVTEVVLGENAVLDHYKLQYESDEAYHVGAMYLEAQRSATCTSNSISMGGALVRNEIVASLDGEGVECTLNGLYLADAARLVDHHTTIDHARPHCGSRELYKGILSDHARGVFNGKIIVRPDAQKTDARQTNRALLLSEDALINTKPQLEIFANDVKCTHGAAVGQLDDDARFYLRSRGLSDEEARRMLVHAFAADVLNRLPLAAVRTHVEERLQQQLARAWPAAA